MEPVKRTEHNVTYRGEHEDEESGEIVNEGVGDLTGLRVRPGLIFAHYKPTAEEVAALLNGGHVQVGIYTEPIPPISVGVVHAEGTQNGHAAVVADQ